MLRNSVMSLLCAASLYGAVATASAKNLSEMPAMINVAEQCQETAHRNEQALGTAILGYLSEAAPHAHFRTLRSVQPFANPQSPCRVHIEIEVASVGAERKAGDHFAAMLLGYPPGIHYHSYLRATVFADQEPLTAAEATMFVDKWIATREPVLVYLRQPDAKDKESTVVCRMPLEEYVKTADKPRWSDCSMIGQIREGYW